MGVSKEDVGEFGLQWPDRRAWDGQRRNGSGGKLHVPVPSLLLKGFVPPEWAELTLNMAILVIKLLNQFYISWQVRVNPSPHSWVFPLDT